MLSVVNAHTFPICTQHQYKDIVGWYTQLTNDYSDIARFVDSIGKSVEGRDMPAVHITKLATPSNTVYFQCQIHASEGLACLNSHRS